MKFSFSTKGWHNSTFEEFCDIAQDLGFEGIELHNIHNRLFTDKDGAFHDYAAAATLRRLYEKKLQLPCIDAIGDVADPAATDECIAEIRQCMEIARNLKIPAVRVRAEAKADADAAVEVVYSLLSKLLPEAEEQKVTLLVETAGLFVSTAKLRDLLDRFASDYLAALWNVAAAYLGAGEDADDIIKNLGIYVRHVHINDAARRIQFSHWILSLNLYVRKYSVNTIGKNRPRNIKLENTITLCPHILL